MKRAALTLLAIMSLLFMASRMTQPIPSAAASSLVVRSAK